MKKCAICGRETDGGFVYDRDCVEQILDENGKLKAENKRLYEALVDATIAAETTAHASRRMLEEQKKMRKGGRDG